MAGETVLIAAYSGRALAASARRAGYRPLVVDAFGDLDMREHAESFRTLTSAIAAGFRPKSLMGALSDLARTATSPPIGVVLGAGFEDAPELVDFIAERFRVLGCTSAAIQATKDPAIFFPLIASRGVPHPATSRTPPDSDGWLVKRIGGSGGTHIRRWRPGRTSDDGHYFQRFAEGRPLSMLGVVDEKGAAFAFSRQWTNPAPGRPCRYGGAVGDVTLPPALEAELIEIGVELSKSFSLRGLVTFDFLEHDGKVSLLEINPRAGASLDVLDDERGSLFRAHMTACLGGDALPELARYWSPEPKAAAYLYADHGQLTIGFFDWPDWTADRACPGTVVAKGRPLASIVTRGRTGDEAETLCRDRLGQLTELMYGAAKKGKETHK